MAVDPAQIDRLTAGAPTGDEVVALLVDAFKGCHPDVLAAVPAAETEETSAA